MTQSQQRYAHSMMNTFGAPKRVLVRGEGCRVWDEDGTEYLDFLAGIAVNALGHAHPAVVEAVSTQVARLAHVSNYFATPSQIGLAERLLRISGADDAARVFFANSGTEANEGALKLARRHRPGATVLALEGAFHGRTMGALTLTAKASMRDPFAPLLPGIAHVPVELGALEQALAAEPVAAVFVEPIQGEGGAIDLPEGFLQGARELTSRYGALLILDEVQTGMGRTGDWFAFQHEGIQPDAVTVAKGIAGGLPLAAIIAFGEAASLLAPGQHGSTFGGNPLVTAAAGAVIDTIEGEGLLENVQQRSAQLREALLGLNTPKITGLSGRGLLVGVGLSGEFGPAVVDAALAHGLIINATGPDRLRLAPPLIVSAEEIDEFIARFSAALEEGSK